MNLYLLQLLQIKFDRVLLFDVLPITIDGTVIQRNSDSTD